MQKYRRICLLFFVMPFIQLCLSFNLEEKVGWISFIVSPLSQENDLEIPFLYRASATRDKQQFLLRIYLQNDQYPNRILAFQNSEYVDKGIVKDIARLFILDHKAVSEGSNTLFFSCLSNGYLDEIEVVGHTRLSSPFLLSDTNSQVASPYNYIELRDGFLYLKRDMLVFDGFFSVVEDDYYYNLNLSSLNIYSENPLFFSSFSLYIEDSVGLYSLFPRGLSFGYREIPAQITAYDSNNYEIRYAKGFFVNPDTLMMSPIKKEGFISTDYFYFPKEHFKTERDVRFKMLISNCGYNEIDIVYNFTYYSHLQFMGDCLNSQYCIGVSTPEDDSVLSDWQETII